MPDDYAVLSHGNHFYLVHGFYFSWKNPLEEKRGKISRVEIVVDEEGAFKVFATDEEARLYAWKKVEKTYL